VPHSGSYISNRAYSNQRLSAPSAAAVAAAAPAAAGISSSSSSSTLRPMASAEAQSVQQQQVQQQQQRRRRHVRGGLSVQSADESDYDELLTSGGQQPTTQLAHAAKQS
jgi:hypothetical protein